MFARSRRSASRASRRNFRSADFWVARGLCVLLGLMAVENLLTLLLEIYRPRVKGKIARPLYESRVVGIFAQPESLFTTAAQTLDYQFGFKVSETWFFQAAQKNLAALLLIQFAVLIVVHDGRVRGRGRTGRAGTFRQAGGRRSDPGAHFKLPWPADKIYRFRTEQIQSLYGRLHAGRAERGSETRFSGRSATTRRKIFSSPTAPPPQPRQPAPMTRPKRRPSA